MLVQEEEEEVGDVEEVGEEERMENLEEGQLKIGEQVEKYDLRYELASVTVSHILLTSKIAPLEKPIQKYF